ncbi:uncharacterized protein LOC129583501 [Paramacrobiotus metropolitanus]|uniref:uncharacterized protein LOC129583501 n=1 Tax=Paramacrobiotus metropolitanus TaxID=2943436 RepID=UPI002445C054|nr:uncharacterized protein LOC129583501 [Paramacrobiotus metropolitanus]
MISSTGVSVIFARMLKYNFQLKLPLMICLIIVGVASQTPSTPPLTTGRPLLFPFCDFTTQSPADQENCNRTNSYTLPNGRFVDQFRRFCQCALDNTALLQLICSGAQDVFQRACNADGTYRCNQSVWVPGGRICLNSEGISGPFNFSLPEQPPCIYGFCGPACIRYSKDTKQFQNIGQCSCEVARKQVVVLDSNSVPVRNDNYVPQCKDDGSWQSKQTGYGGTWCVNSATGAPTGPISFDMNYPPPYC